MSKENRTSGTAVLWQKNAALYAIGDPGKISEGDICTAKGFQVSDYIPLSGRELLVLRMPVTTDAALSFCGMCFYDEEKKLLPGCGVTFDFCSTAACDAAEDNMTGPVVTKRIYIPRDAAWFRTTYWNDAGVSDRFPFTCEFSRYSDESRPFTHVLPTCVEMNNVVKRARQLTDIRWEPLVDIPRYCLMYSDYSGQSAEHFLDWCKAGCEYTGIPYSGAGEPDRNTKKINPETFCGKWGYYKFHVGIDIDFETFVTACRYPGSIFGERTNQTGPSFDSSPYGTYCSALVGYALGYEQPLPKVVEFTDSENFVKVSDHLTDIAPEKIRLCDILRYGAFHIAIITDLIHDDSGKVIRIEVSEATTVGNGNNTVLNNRYGGLCRRKMWDVRELCCWYREYGLYRVKSFAGIPYRKSEFVDVGNESGSMPVVDLPLIPYLGNRARYKKGHIVNDTILVGAAGFSEVVIEKDGKPFKTLPIEGKKHVHGGFSEEGSYTAYLQKEGSRTRSCRWTVE